MRKLIAVTVAAMTIALLALWLVPASSQPASRHVTLQVFDSEKTGYEKNVDVGKKGFSPGDEFLAVDPLLNPDTCKKAGTSITRGTVIRQLGNRNGNFLFDGTLRLPAGRLTFEFGGRFSEFSKRIEVPVTGGSGAFDGATGQGTATRGKRCGEPGELISLDVSVR